MIDEITAEFTSETVLIQTFVDGQLISQQRFQYSPITIGRGLECNLVVPFAPISRMHAYLYKSDGKWRAHDSKSRNGLTVNGVRQTVFDLNGTTDLCIGNVQLRVTLMGEGTTAQYDDEADAKFDADEFSEAHAYFANSPLPPPLLPQTSEEVPERPGARRLTTAEAQAWSAKRPVLQLQDAERTDGDSADGSEKAVIPFDADLQLLSMHPHAVRSVDRHLEVLIAWHDRVLSAEEYPAGVAIYFEFNGRAYNLGLVGKDKTLVRVPQPFRASSPAASLTVTPEKPLHLEAANGVRFCIRYISPPYALSRISLPVPEKDLLSPILISAAVHGTLAMTIATNPPPDHGPKLKNVPERYARLISAKPAPTPPPIATPAPTPTPVPIATPRPTPEPRKPSPKTPPKKRSQPIAQSTRPVPQPAPRTAAAQPKSLDERNKLPLKVEAPAAKPFDAQKVGALSAFAALNPSTNANLAMNTVKIEKTSGRSDGSGVTTGNVMNDLKASSQGGGSRDSAVAINTGKIGYGSGGISGAAGKRDVSGAKLGKFEVGAFTKTEGLTREQVLAEVQKHQSKIQQCYERSLIENPSLAGRAQFEWMISAEGAVSDVAVKESNLANGGELLECVKAIFRKMRFAKSKNHETTNPSIGLPFGRL